MRTVAESFGKLVTGRGLYQVWELTRRGESIVLVTRWIDPAKEAHELLKRRRVKTEEDSDQPPTVWRTTFVSLFRTGTVGSGRLRIVRRRLLGRALLAGG